MHDTILDRLSALSPLTYGSHNADNGKACLLEAVAYVAGEPWSDHPACVCPVIATFGRALNDAMPDDATRDRLLRPLVPLLIGTVADAGTERRRAYIAADWAVRTAAPIALRAAGLILHADALGALPEIAGSKTAAYTAARAADAAYTAARAADAAARAAYTAARAAARAADAAADAADAAAYAAARAADAAADAVWEAAADCLRRMCEA